MKNTIKAAALVLGFALTANTAAAAGFALYEYSARGNAMGGAAMANKAEAASLAINPALITQIEGAQIQAGATFVMPHATTEIDFSPDGGKRDLDDAVFTLPSFYASYQASENVFLGLAGFSRFGLGGEYSNEKSWAGSAVAYKFNLLSFSITPVISAKVTDSLSLSMGLEAMYLDFSESKYYGAFGPLRKVKVAGDGISYGGVLSAYYNPDWADNKLGFGLAYRFKTRQVLDGALDTTVAGITTSEDVRGSVTLPDSINFGVAYRFSDKLVVESGIVATFWSSYDSIRIDKKHDITASILEDKNYKDVYRLNIGAEYSLNDNWDLRAGYVFDKSPTNKDFMDTLVPVGDRHLLNAGVGYENKTWGLDLSYTYLIGVDMSGGNNIGTLPAGVKYTNADSHMVGVTFKYKFGQRFIRSASSARA
jgi:long-chain fatty acid transport protein